MRMIHNNTVVNPATEEDAIKMGIVKADWDKGVFNLALLNKQTQIKGDFQAECAPLLAKYADFEIHALPVLANEAEFFIANPDSPTPIIDAVLAVTNDDKTVFCNLIMENSKTFYKAVGTAIGKRRLATKLIDEATTVNQVNAVTWLPF